jgi:hypothetical protein
MVAAKQSPEFTKAIADSKTLSKTPSNDELLEVRPVETPCSSCEGLLIEHC